MLPKFSRNSVSNVELLVNHGLGNEALIFDDTFTADWPLLSKWRSDDGAPNVEFLREQFADVIVPFLVDGLCDYEWTEFDEFVKSYYLCKPRQKIAYLKDWHCQKQCPDACNYKLPDFLSMDWINNEIWTNDDDNPTQGDYRFVYFGLAGSWTKFHTDVMSTFSWSLNVCGQKRWYLLRRGAERFFATGKDTFVEDIRAHRDRWADAGVLEFVQRPGEIVFVPSGWYHQVHNVEDSISINHNVINVCNVHILWHHLERRMEDVEREIDDVREVFTREEFMEQCQKILLADCRMNLPNFIRLLDLIIESRFTDGSVDDLNKYGISCSDGAEEIDRQKLKQTLLSNCECMDNQRFCDSCRHFVSRFEWARAGHFKRIVQQYMDSK